MAGKRRKKSKNKSQVPKRTAAVVNGNGMMIGGLKLRELTVATTALLQEVDSPLLRADRGEVSDERKVITSLFIMTRPAIVSSDLITEGGVEALTRAAFVWADDVPATDLIQFTAVARASTKRLTDVLEGGEPAKGGAEGNVKSTGTDGT